MLSMLRSPYGECSDLVVTKNTRGSEATTRSGRILSAFVLPLGARIEMTKIVEIEDRGQKGFFRPFVTRTVDRGMVVDAD